MPFNIGPGELIIVLIIALIVVGPGKLPDVGSALGKSIREFRKAAADVKESTALDLSTEPAPAPVPAPLAAAPAAAAPVPTPVPAATTAEPAAESVETGV
jgi:sec-independent protein translocase protein TatA